MKIPSDAIGLMKITWNIFLILIKENPIRKVVNILEHLNKVYYLIMLAGAWHKVLSMIVFLISHLWLDDLFTTKAQALLMHTQASPANRTSSQNEVKASFKGTGIIFTIVASLKLLGIEVKPATYSF